jgi:hypothetical protein
LVASRKNPLLGGAAKATDLVRQAIEPILGCGMVDVANRRVRASQTLTSGRSIFIVQDLRDALAGQVHGAGFAGSNERHLNAPLLALAAIVGRTVIRNGYLGPFRQGTAAFQNHNAVLNSTGDFHMAIIVEQRRPIKSSPGGPLVAAGPTQLSEIEA